MKGREKELTFYSGVILAHLLPRNSSSHVCLHVLGIDGDAHT